MLKTFFRRLVIVASLLAVAPPIAIGWIHGAAAVNGWLNNGTALYYLLGNVGIGTSTPGTAGTGGLAISSTDPQIGDDPNYRRAFDVTTTAPIAALNPSFTNSFGSVFSITPTDGDNSFGGGTNAKTTFAALGLTSTARAAGQRFVSVQNQTCYGIGDCFLQSRRLSYAGHDIAGDEGQGFYPQDLLTQQPNLALATISSKPTQSTYSSTITQNIVGAYSTQTVTVAATTNAVVGDWIVVGQEIPSGTPNLEAVQITAIGSGTITAVFRNNHTSGATLTPALVLVLSDGSFLGQGRVLVNLSGTSYSTGTVSSIVGGGLTGSGTTWTANMVGGSTTNIGAIAMTADDYTGAPFNSTGAQGTLKSWYQITTRSSNTGIGIFSYSTAADQGYNGLGPGSGGYIIRPAARVLKVSGTTVICETTSATWSAGHNVELSISPFPDVSLESNQIAAYTPGGTYRSAKKILNVGARKFGSGLLVDALLQTGSNAATVAFATGVDIEAPVDFGMIVRNAGTAAITLDPSTSDSGGKIRWQNISDLVPNSTNHGFDWALTWGSDNNGNLRTKSSAGIGTGSLSSLNFGGMIGTTPQLFSTLPTCAAGTEGLTANVTDSSTAVWGATVTGSSGNHILARCNGSNWTVVGK